MGRIVLISPFKDLSTMVSDVARDLGVEVEIYEGGMEMSRQVIEKLTGPEIDVFISRGGTADFLATTYDIPVISINTGIYDIMESCEEARKNEKNIAITSFGKPFTGMKLLEKAMNITITEIVFKNLIDLQQRIEALAEEGGYCVVGGGQSVQVARQLGLPSVFLRASRDTIRDALLRAVEVAELRREEKRKSYRLKAILDSAYDGIIAIDSCGRIEIFNKTAEQMLGMEADKVIGMPVNEAVPGTRLNEVLENGKFEIGEFQNVGNVRIVTNRVPVKNDAEIMGAVATFQDVSRVIQVEQRLRREMTKTQFKAKYKLEDIIGNSPAITDIKTMARSFANSSFTVLIYGPSGSGKEMFAQGIHNASKRVLKPFVAINCAALPPTLLESELFGYDEGAFTGAKRKGKLGLFELAHTGTVFLDEIDALPIDLQGRLLRVIQEKEVLRVGGETVIPVNIRIIAATNKSPYELVANNKMREDLFYRLNVLYLELPRLIDHKDDIPLLCRHFLTTEKYEQISGVLNEMMPIIKQYSWPGNIRELQNFCQRLSFYQENFLLGKDAEALVLQIAPYMLANRSQNMDDGELTIRVQAYEAEIIKQAVKEAGSIRKAANKLGISKSALARKLKLTTDMQSSQ